MIVSCEIMFFVNVCSNMIEMKMFVSNATIWQNKISPIKCQNQNISITDKIGGSPSIKSGDTGGLLRNRSDFNQALSTLNRLHRESGGPQFRPMPYWKYQQWQPSSSSSSTWCNGMNPGGLLKNSKKVNERGCMQRFKIERGNPLFTELWRKPQTKGFQEFIFFL